MKRSFEEAIANRRSYYHLSDVFVAPNDEIVCAIHEVIKHVPSAYNSQTTRIVLLLGEEHRKLWDIVKQTLKRLIPGEVYAKTEIKINHSFASGYGTVLFYEDDEAVQKFKKDFPLYADNFETWSQHTNAMHQFAVWTLLEDKGFGASLQHYNPLIDEEVRRVWNLPKEWKLVAQMPFGMPVSMPGEKKYKPVEDRIRIYK